MKTPTQPTIMQITIYGCDNNVSLTKREVSRNDNDVNRFMTDLNKSYALQGRNSMENGFIKADKQLLNGGVF